MKALLAASPRRVSGGRGAGAKEPANDGGQAFRGVPMPTFKLWWEAHHLVLPVCALAGGPPAARHIAAASKALRHAVAEVWQDLARGFPCRLYVVGGIDDGYRPMDAVERYDPALGEWEPLPSLNSARGAATAVVLAGRLYLLGGEVQGRALRDAQRFDPWLGAWEQLPPMHAGRIRAAAVVSGNFLYVIGGLDGARALRSAERYDPCSRKWQVLPPMHRPRYACVATALEGCIYVFGGELTDAGIMASIERFDPNTREWEILPAVRAPGCGAAVAVAAGMAWTLGGLGPSGQALECAERVPLAELLAGAAPAWEPLPPMPTARHLASAASYRGGVCAVGGKGSTFEAVRDVALFNLATGSWEVMPPLPGPRLRAAVAGGLL